MRILLCGEGSHEFGEAEVWDARSEVFNSVEGWMQPLTRKLRPEQLEFEIRRRGDLQLLRPKKPALAGHAEKARLARFIASNEDFDAVIFMSDADSSDVRRWREIIGEVQAGFDAIADSVTVSAVPCVPMSASESWLLSDFVAWQSLGLKSQALLPRRPESIWGARDDPADDHPHRYFARVCNAAGLTDDRDTRMRLATAIDTAALRRGCPTSFGHFEDALRAL